MATVARGLSRAGGSLPCGVTGEEPMERASSNEGEKGGMGRGCGCPGATPSGLSMRAAPTLSRGVTRSSTATQAPQKSLAAMTRGTTGAWEGRQTALAGSWECGPPRAPLHCSWRGSHIMRRQAGLSGACSRECSVQGTLRESFSVFDESESAGDGCGVCWEGATSAP